jgi:hypothetical protein
LRTKISPQVIQSAIAFFSLAWWTVITMIAVMAMVTVMPVMTTAQK